MSTTREQQASWEARSTYLPTSLRKSKAAAEAEGCEPDAAAPKTSDAQDALQATHQTAPKDAYLVMTSESLSEAMLYTHDLKGRPVILKSARKSAEESFEKPVKMIEVDVDVEEGMPRHDLAADALRGGPPQSGVTQRRYGKMEDIKVKFRGQLLDSKTRLEDKNRQLLNSEAKLAEKDKQLIEKEANLVEKDKHLAEKETKLMEKDKQLSDSETKPAAVEMQYRECLTECEAVVNVCDQNLAECEKLLAKKNEMVRELRAQLKQARRGKSGL
ncbi:hypothetical protein TI39_contig1342g00003 [Zymoseptoria brevis]|uniref:Uncharacterized protein n=1 Tax=Zymoseptoria brevis TaxID=1047168 RepID=A0A0F4GHM8_9PEZI|nr:hypothetical protein TI39_contig1342g00003 [Zymoseptoria brevis]